MGFWHKKFFRSSKWKAVKAILGEFIGTAIWVFLGVATSLNWNHAMDHDQILRIGLALGIYLAGIIYAFGPISGALVNPALTVAFMITRRLKVVIGFLYILVQCLGAIAGSGILYSLQQKNFGGNNTSQFGLTKVNPLLCLCQGFFIEFIATMIFVLIILLATHKTKTKTASEKAKAAIVIGFTLSAIEFGFMNSTGASVNPARSLGPAIIVLDFQDLWIYWLGPILGAAIAVPFYLVFTWKPKSTPKVTTTDDAAQTPPIPEIKPKDDDNDIEFVSSDISGAPSYDEFFPEDKAHPKSREIIL